MKRSPNWLAAFYIGAAVHFLARATVDAAPTQETYLKASNPGGFDQFGSEVAVSGDTMVVAAPSEDSAATGVDGDQADNTKSASGAVYVFIRSGGTWVQQAYLKASNSGVNDGFGAALAISGDTIVVGAYQEASNANTINGNQLDNSVPAAGAAYVFVRNAGVWTQQAYLKPSTVVETMSFGKSVAIEGDTIIVGAPTEDGGSAGVNGNQADQSINSSGAGYVFVRNAGVWSQQAYLKASNPYTLANFGTSVDISSNTVVIGAPIENGGSAGVNGNQASQSAAQSGAAYVFVRNGAAWSQQAYIKASNPDPYDNFAQHVAISGDTIVAGAFHERSQSRQINGDQLDNSSPNGNTGAAYVFARQGITWSQQAYLKPSNLDPGDSFGVSVAVSGDLIVAGAYNEASNAVGINGSQIGNTLANSGAAYLFSRTGSTWTQRAYVKASNTDSNDLFGAEVCIEGDTMVVGSLYEASPATGANGNQALNTLNGAGAVYVYTGISTPLLSGNVDSTFAPNPNANMSSTPMLPDGKMLMCGNFTTTSGVAKNCLARYTSTDVVDGSYGGSVIGVPGSTGVYAAVVQPDGSQVVGGLFTTVGGLARSNIGRVLANGAVDTGFTTSLNEQVRGLAILPNGKLLVAGFFTTVNGAAQAYVARLNTDGTLDSAYAPVIVGQLRTLALQSDSKLLIGGNLTSVNGTARVGIARLNADGTLDTTFNAALNSGAVVYSIAQQADGKILIGGLFTTVGGVGRVDLARVSLTGALDSSFTLVTNGLVRSMVLQADGQIILGGDFATVGGQSRNRIARASANGTLDATFDPNSNAVVQGVDLLANGQITVSTSGGTSVGGYPRNNFARLVNEPATQTLSATSTSRIQWLRGGTSPETLFTTVEISTNNGGTWSTPVAGQRISGGWEFTGLSLPVNGIARARARTTGGYANGSSGIVENTLQIGLTSVETWRQTNFGSSLNTGNGADLADPDRDGLENLIEFAFGLLPNSPDAGMLPVWTPSGNNIVLNFTAPVGATGITYAAEQSPSLSADSWTPIPNSSVPPNYSFSVPSTGANRRFVRLRVTNP